MYTYIYIYICTHAPVAAATLVGRHKVLRLGLVRRARPDGRPTHNSDDVDIYPTSRYIYIYIYIYI